MSRTRSFAARAGLLALLVVGPTARGGAAEATLRWKLKTGETLRYEFRQKNEIKVKAAGGQGSDNTTELTIDLTWKVKGVNQDGTAEVTLVVDRVRSEIRLGPQTIKYDSKDQAADDPGARPLKAVYGAAVGVEYTLQIDARGRVVGAKVPAKVTEALLGSPFVATADGGSVLSEKGLMNLFAQLLPVLPEKAVDKGATWSTDLELPVPPMRLSLSYKEDLAAIDDATARVDAAIHTTIKPDPDAPFTVDVKKQSGNRSVTLDTKNGRVTTSTVTQSVELTLGFMNREIEQVISLEEHMKLVP